MNIIYSWLGSKDLSAPVATDKKLGPVADALLHMPEPPDKAVLLFDHRSDEEQPGQHYLTWLNTQLRAADKKTQAVLRPLVKKVPEHNPTSYNWVFDAMRRVVEEHDRTCPLDRKLKRHYLLGPGTPTMVACTLVIARMAACAGELWQVDERSPQRCRRIELPFNMRLDDAPDPHSGVAERWQKSQAHRDDTPIIASPAMRRVWQLAERAAACRWPVLITGSTGSGKEVLAQHIYNSSGLGSNGGIYPLNCGAIPENLIEAQLFGYKKGAFSGASSNQIGIFEAASGGMVFLDEVGELPLAAQVKFLRVLQEGEITRIGEHERRKVDCRIVAATHRNLLQAVREGRFREDLYYRLAGILIELPDLVERPEDLEEMIERFWTQTQKENPGFPGRRLHDDARQRLLAHSWPGNVRELRTTLMRAAFLADGPEVRVQDIELALTGGAVDNSRITTTNTKYSTAPPPEPKAASTSLKQAVEDYKHQLVEQALAQAQGHQARAAHALGISPQHIGRLLRR